MKKIFLPLVFLLIIACSAENDDIKEPQTEFSELNAVFEIEGCAIVSYGFDDLGILEVTNNEEKLFVHISSISENYELSSLRLHIADSETSFPTVGKGNLPPGQMEHQIDFETGVASYTFELPLADLGECFFIASQATFLNGEESVTTWAGDYEVKHGDWKYLQYCTQECLPACENPVYTGPSVLSNTINYTVAQQIPSVDEARKLFSNQIGQTGEYHGSGRDFQDFSRYSPRISVLVEEFNTVLDEPFDTYDLKTTYSYGTGECSGTIDLILTIVDDRVIQ